MTIDELTFAGPHRIAQIRYVKDDGKYHRECRNPGDDLSDLPDDARKQIEAEWTPEVVAAYQKAIRDSDPVESGDFPLDPRDVKIAELEARIAKLEAGGRK